MTTASRSIIINPMEYDDEEYADDPDINCLDPYIEIPMRKKYWYTINNSYRHHCQRTSKKRGGKIIKTEIKIYILQQQF